MPPFTYKVIGVSYEGKSFEEYFDTQADAERWVKHNRSGAVFCGLWRTPIMADQYTFIGNIPVPCDR